MVYLEGKKNPVRADSIQTGDVLQGASEVVKITKVTRNGVYTPLTASGKIVVDGVQASSYISMQEAGTEFIQCQGVNLPMSQQDFVHTVLSPFRLLCQGVSSSLCESANEDGIPHYVDYGMKFIQWADKTQTLPVQILILVAAFFVFGTSMFLENVFGASWTPLVALVMGMAYTFTKAKGISVRKAKAV